MRGLGIIDRTIANVPCVRTLIEQNLTVSLLDRLKSLFKMRNRWTLDEMEPYIEYARIVRLPSNNIFCNYDLLFFI